MTVKGHILLASAITLATSLLLREYYDLGNALPYFYLAVVVGSVFPDIDEPESYIGNKMKIVSINVSSLFGHRTFTHFLILPIALFTLSFYVENELNKILISGFAFGVFLHDIGDMLTNGGIKGFLFPFMIDKRIALLPRFLRFETFSVEEMSFIYLLLLPLNIFLFLKVFGESFEISF